MKKIKNWFLGLFTSIAVILGIHNTIPETNTIDIKPNVTPAPVIEPISQSKRISIICDTTCTDEEAKGLKLIVDRLLEVQSNACFLNGVLNGIDPNQTNEMMPHEVVQHIVSTKVSTQLTYYYQGRNWFTKTLVIGFENGDGKIHANRAAWKDMSLCEKVGNVAHELTHQLGYSHDFNNTTRRKFSVPYVVGDVAEKCCKENLGLVQ